jgi:hypothetical protein
VRDKWNDFQTTNRASPLRRTIGFVVLDGDGPIKMHQGDDAGVQLMNLLSEICPAPYASPMRHPAGLVGFDIHSALSIAAFDSAAAGFPPPYWAWNSDQRAPNWFLDPYRYICATSSDREIITVRDVLARCGWPEEKNIETPLGEAEAARYLAQALGLCP